MSQTREAPILRRRKNDLPQEIVLNILTRLPAKSVIRFRCVCKPWNSSITTSYFISTHLNNFAHNHDTDTDNGDGYIIHMPRHTRAMNSSNRPVCTVALDRTFDRIFEIEIPFDFPSGFSKIVGSCNGLLCLAAIGGRISDYAIYLWNPSIRKFKRLPDSCLGKLDSVALGFAYHSENNDYKVLRILRNPAGGQPIPAKIEVYTLSSDSWRRVGMSLGANVMVFDHDNFQIPLVSGALHWISLVLEGEEEHKGEVIMSFDVNSEKFRMLRMPDGSMSIKSFQKCLASFKEKLAFLTFGKSEQHGYHYSIWVMREYGMLESWNKIFVVPFQRFSLCIAFTMHGSLLIHCLDLPNQEQDFVLVDTETLHEKVFDIQQPLYVATFMESLALLDGANMVSY